MDYALKLSGTARFTIEGAVAAARRTGEGIYGIAATEYGGKEGKLTLDGCYTDLLSGLTHEKEILLKPYQTAILKKK